MGEMDSAGRRGWASFHGGHTSYSGGGGTVAATAQMAAARGFRAFGFTEHFALPPCREFSPDGVLHPMAGQTGWLGDYVAEVQAAQAVHADRVTLVLGTELEYISALRFGSQRL